MYITLMPRVYISDIQITSLVKTLLDSFFPFFNWAAYLPAFDWHPLLYTFRFQVFFPIYLTSTFSPFVACLFIFSAVSFKESKFLIWSRAYQVVFFFSFVMCALCVFFCLFVFCFFFFFCDVRSLWFFLFVCFLFFFLHSLCFS